MENNESIQPKEEPKEEPMETDQNDINLSEIKKEIEEETKQEAQTEIKKEVEAESETKQEAQPETKVNGVHLNGTEEKSKPGSFRLKVTGLPKFYPVAEFRKLVTEEFGLNINFLKNTMPKKGHPWVLMSFNSAEEQQKAFKNLNKLTWRKKVLSCTILVDGNKRKTDSNISENAAKKAKLDMPIAERILLTTLPYHSIPYEEQLVKKSEDIKSIINRIGDLISRRNPTLAGWVEHQKKICDGLPCKMDEIKPSPVTEAYRNKCEFRVGVNPENQERTVGCRLENLLDGTVAVGPPVSLKHLPDDMIEVVKVFETYVRQSDKEPFTVEKNEGYWRNIIVRQTTSGQLMLGIVIHPQNLTPEEIEELKKNIIDFFTNREGKAVNITSLYFTQFAGKLMGAPAPPMEHIMGKEFVEDTLFELTFELSPTSYFQFNTKAAENMFQVAMDLIEPSEEDIILDLCCGTGAIGLCIAKKVNKVIGVENISLNVEDNVKNAAKNNITNVEYLPGKVEDIMPDLIEKCKDKNVVAILDPPRNGLNSKTISQLREIEGLKRLIYISFHNKAPIRNFLDLCQTTSNTKEGLPLVPIRAVPIDLAPHSSHVVMVVVFERVDPAPYKSEAKPVKNDSKPPRKSRLSRGGKSSYTGRGRGLFRSRGGLSGPGMMRGMNRPMQMRGPPRGVTLPPPPPPMRGPMPPIRNGGLPGRGGPRAPVPPLRRPGPMPLPFNPPMMGPGPRHDISPRDMRGPRMPPRDMPHSRDMGMPPMMPRLQGPRSLMPGNMGPPLPIDRGYYNSNGGPSYHQGHRPLPRRQTIDFASDEQLTLSRYSDFRRDVEDAINSTYGSNYPQRSWDVPHSRSSFPPSRKDMNYRNSSNLNPYNDSFSQNSTMKFQKNSQRGRGGGPRRGSRRGRGRN